MYISYLYINVSVYIYIICVCVCFSSINSGTAKEMLLSGFSTSNRDLQLKRKDSSHRQYMQLLWLSSWGAICHCNCHRLQVCSSTVAQAKSFKRTSLMMFSSWRFDKCANTNCLYTWDGAVDGPKEVSPVTTSTIYYKLQIWVYVTMRQTSLVWPFDGDNMW